MSLDFVDVFGSIILSLIRVMVEAVDLIDEASDLMDRVENILIAELIVDRLSVALMLRLLWRGVVYMLSEI